MCGLQLESAYTWLHQDGQAVQHALELDQLDPNDPKDAFELALKSHPDFEEAHLGLAAVLMSLRQPGLALPHVQKAIALNHDDAVSWYRLARAEKALGNTAEAEKADAEFKRLRGNSSEHIAAPAIFTPDQVTQQE